MKTFATNTDAPKTILTIIALYTVFNALTAVDKPIKTAGGAVETHTVAKTSGAVNIDPQGVTLAPKLTPDGPPAVLCAFAVPPMLDVHTIDKIFSRAAFGLDVEILRPHGVRGKRVLKFAVESVKCFE